MKKLSLYLLVLIFILALIKHFYLFPQRAMFEFDQEYLASQAKSILIDKKPSLIGAPTSIGGMFIGPFYNYFISLTFLVGGMSPFVVDFVSNLWGLFTILSIFFIGKKLLNEKAAFFASLLAILSFNFLQTQGLPPLLFPLPLSSLLLFYLLTQKKINWIGVAILLGLSFHLHFTAVFFPVMILTLFLIRKEKIKAKELSLPLLIFFFFLSPLVFFELRHQFFISKNFINFLLQSEGSAFNLFSQIICSLSISLESLSNLVYPQASFFPKMLLALAVLVSAFVLGKKKKEIKLSLVWLLLPIVCFSFYKGHIINYYFVIQEPIFFLLFGFVLSVLFKKMVGKVLVGFLFIFLFYSLVFTRHSWTSNHGLYYKTKAFDFIEDRMGDGEFYLSFTIEPAHMGGYQYLSYYYKFNLLGQPSDQYPTATIIQPHFWHDIKSDYIFGDIGVGFSNE